MELIAMVRGGTGAERRNLYLRFHISAYLWFNCVFYPQFNLRLGLTDKTPFYDSEPEHE